MLQTNLKEKIAPKELNKLEEAHILQLTGTMICDSPNEYLDRWDGNVTYTLEKGKKEHTFNGG